MSIGASRTVPVDKSGFYSQKVINKCKNMDLDPELVEKNKLGHLFFKDHVYENILHFGSKPKVENGRVLLPYQKTATLKSVGIGSSGSLIDYYEKAQNNNYAFLIRENNQNGVHKRIAARDISYEDFYEYCTEEVLDSRVLVENVTKGPFGWIGDMFGYFRTLPLLSDPVTKQLNLSNIIVVEPVEYLSIEQLHAKGIVDYNSGKDRYETFADIPYLQNGFQARKIENPEKLVPYKKLENHNGKFYFEIVVHTKGQPNLYGGQGHASLRLTSASGEVYSAGLVYEGDQSGDGLLYTAKSVIVSPDDQEFLPASSYMHQSKRYEVGSAEDFQKLVNIVEEEMIGVRNKDNLSSIYHVTKNNCAHFCKRVLDKALVEIKMKDTHFYALHLINKISSFAKTIFASTILWIYSLVRPAIFHDNDKQYAKEIEGKTLLFPAFLLD